MTPRPWSRGVANFGDGIVRESTHKVVLAGDHEVGAKFVSIVRSGFALQSKFRWKRVGMKSLPSHTIACPHSPLPVKTTTRKIWKHMAAGGFPSVEGKRGLETASPQELFNG